ncbi:unnamed protein product, partial [Symbiodinium necroappetens]
MHRRLWAKHYVALWRHLWRRNKGEHYRHCYSVLGLSGAPTPPSALALSRAVLLRQVSIAGPVTLLQLLHVQWQETPKVAWLGEIRRDIQHVAQYAQAARTLLGTRDAVRSLVEALQDDPDWWVRQVKNACKTSVTDMVSCAPPPSSAMDGCRGARPPDAAATRAQVHGVPRKAHACPWCEASFDMRKHLGAFARLLGTSRISNTMMNVREVEGTEARQAKSLRRGAWDAFTAALPTLQSHGHKTLTTAERIDLLGEDLNLGLLSRLFRPDPTFLAWVSSFIQSRSKDGPRGYAAAFWDN